MKIISLLFGRLRGQGDYIMFYFFLVCNIFRQLNGFPFGACPAINFLHPFFRSCEAFLKIWCVVFCLPLSFRSWGRRTFPLPAIISICQGIPTAGRVPAPVSRESKSFSASTRMTRCEGTAAEPQQCRSVRVCLDPCDTVPCQSETTRFIIQLPKGLR